MASNGASTKDRQAQRSALAAELDCITEVELQALGGVKPSTTEAWRKRGTGPAYIRFGTQFLYPKTAVAEFLRARLRTAGTSAKDAL